MDYQQLLSNLLRLNLISRVFFQDDSTPDGEEIDVSPSTELMISNLKITRGQDGVLHLKGAFNNIPISMGG